MALYGRRKMIHINTYYSEEVKGEVLQMWKKDSYGERIGRYRLQLYIV